MLRVTHPGESTGQNVITIHLIFGGADVQKARGTIQTAFVATT